MTKQMEILRKLEYFAKKADQLFELERAYKEAAELFDKEYREFSEGSLKITRDRMHPCHMQKAAIEATIDLAAN